MSAPVDDLRVELSGHPPTALLDFPGVRPAVRIREFASRWAVGRG